MKKLYKSPTEAGAFVLRLPSGSNYHLSNNGIRAFTVQDPEEFEFMQRVHFDIGVQSVVDNAIMNIQNNITDTGTLDYIVTGINESIQNFE